ncbi:MAG: serine/threonine protein kinase [Treponema sp.]|nr:serine/threonine protein kinase [Treponema sp.]
MADVPEKIGKYVVKNEIARGGMGVVYKAVHPSLKREVVIKKMTGRGTPETRERFKREAQILLDMQNPYIVHLFDYFTEGSYRYMVEEFVDGMALDKLIKKEKKLGTELSLLVLLDACYALKYAHAKGIVHRDIKPGNILISRRAEIKLTDFGIATEDTEENLHNSADEKKQNSADTKKLKNSDATVTFSTYESVTKNGAMLGTPAYMPPEQFEDSRSVDKRADIYALGVMLYEMATGEKPFAVTTPEAMIQAVKKGRYTKPSKLNPEVNPIIDRLVKKMLKAKPSSRFQTVDPIIKIIRRYLKHFNTHELRVLLAKLVISSNPLKIPPFKANRKSPVVIACCAACAFCIAINLLWKAGYIHKTLLRPWYTPVSITMKMPETHGTGLPVYAYFFVNDSDKIPEVAGSRRSFIEQDKETAFIKPVYLRPGLYRIKIVAGSYVWWDSVEIGKTKKEFDYDFLKNAYRPLRVRFSAKDAQTGENLSDKAECSILYNGKWTSIKEIPSKKFVSGNVWKIRVRCAGYSEEIFSLLIDWYQEEIFISANLNQKQ